MTSKNYGNKVMQATETMAELITILLKSKDKNTRVLAHGIAHQLHVIKNSNQSAIQQLWLYEQEEKCTELNNSNPDITER